MGTGLCFSVSVPLTAEALSSTHIDRTKEKKVR